MSKSYLNKVELKDGQIILFHRQHAKRPIYHMRIGYKRIPIECLSSGSHKYFEA